MISICALMTPVGYEGTNFQGRPSLSFLVFLGIQIVHGAPLATHQLIKESRSVETVLLVPRTWKCSSTTSIRSGELSVVTPTGPTLFHHCSALELSIVLSCMVLKI